MGFKNYDDWEAEQGISPASPESYYAEMAYKAAIIEAKKIIASACKVEEKVSGVAMLAITELEAIEPES